MFFTSARHPQEVMDQLPAVLARTVLLVLLLFSCSFSPAPLVLLPLSCSFSPAPFLLLPFSCSLLPAPFLLLSSCPLSPAPSLLAFFIWDLSPDTPGPWEPGKGMKQWGSVELELRSGCVENQAVGCDLTTRKIPGHGGIPGAVLCRARS